ncbi:MAG: threonylcarbamoyl-AMP synthase [Candidatus Delongbacteria bacterium]|nr:threonylcarbamoyl-AMP synthase [Candidatus Delongbacteria bacterium]
MIIALHEENPKQRDIDSIVATLKNGGVVIYPTDTGYAFGCDLFSKKGVERIIRLKKIDKRKTLSFVCNSFSQISEYADISNDAHKILKQHLPGPYTFLFKALNSVSKTVSGEKKKVGIRIPKNNIDFALVESLGNPIISSSINKYVELLEGNITPLIDPIEIDKVLGKQVDVVIDCGIIKPEFSTVIDLSTDLLEIIREGKGPIDWFTD